MSEGARSDGEVAVGWITCQESWWAYETLSTACADDPERAWRLIQKILQATESSMIIECLGAGPLEDLLAKHGASVIQRMESLAQTDAKFRTCLSHTWQNAMSQEVWVRVCRATDRDPSNVYGRRSAT
jgi:hypothetical protein